MLMESPLAVSSGLQLQLKLCHCQATVIVKGGQTGTRIQLFIQDKQGHRPDVQRYIVLVYSYSNTWFIGTHLPFYRDRLDIQRHVDLVYRDTDLVYSYSQTWCIGTTTWFIGTHRPGLQGHIDLVYSDAQTWFIGTHRPGLQVYVSPVTSQSTMD